MVWFWHVLLGALIGIVARLIDPDKDRMSWVVTIIIGIAGSVGAVFKGQFSGWYGVPSWLASGIAAALAIIFVAIYARTKGKRLHNPALLLSLATVEVSDPLSEPSPFHWAAVGLTWDAFQICPSLNPLGECEKQALLPGDITS